MPLTDGTKARAMSEIKAYQAALWRTVTGEEAEDEDIAEAADQWLSNLIILTTPDLDGPMPQLNSIPDPDFMSAINARWWEYWEEIRIKRAEIFGLRHDTARDFVTEILDTRR